MSPRRAAGVYWEQLAVSKRFTVLGKEGEEAGGRNAVLTLSEEVAQNDTGNYREERATRLPFMLAFEK